MKTTRKWVWKVSKEKEPFIKDIKVLDNISNAYHNCESEDMKRIWKNKWYEMNRIIANQLKEERNHEYETKTSTSLSR
jgi:hypothetical protein